MKTFTSIHGNHEKEPVTLVPYEPLPGFYKHPDYELAISKEGQVFR